MQGFNQRDPKFLLVAYSSEPKILAANNKLTFMLPPSYDAYLEPFVSTTMKAYGKKLGLLGTTTAYGKAWTDAVTGRVGKKRAAAWAATTAWTTTPPPTFRPPSPRRWPTSPTCCSWAAPSQPTALVIKAAREQGFKGGFIVMDQAKFEGMDGVVPLSMMNGAVGVLPLRDFRSPAAQKFVRSYEKIYNKPPTSEMGLNYTGMYVVAKAMELAGSTTDVDAIPGQARTRPLKRCPPSATSFNAGAVDARGPPDGRPDHGPGQERARHPAHDRPNEPLSARPGLA